MVRGSGLDPVRSDAGPWDAGGRVHVRVRLAGGCGGPRRGELGRRTAPNLRTRVPDTSDLLGADASTDRGQAPSLVGIGLVLAACWIAVLGLGKAIIRRGRYLARDPRRVATASRRELEGFLRDQGIDVPPTATLEVLQRLVEQDLGLDGKPFANAARRARFGPPAARQTRRRGRATRGAAAPACGPRAALAVGALPGARLAAVAPVREWVVSDTYDLFQLGRSHLRSGRPAQATVSLEKAKRAEPTSRSIREALGIAYFRIGRWQEAEAEFRMLVELDPSDEFAHHALGRALVNQGRRKEAMPHIKLGRALRPRAPNDDALT